MQVSTPALLFVPPHFPLLFFSHQSRAGAQDRKVRPKRRSLDAAIVRVSERPGVQVVPAAMGMATDQAPDAQRWKLEPSLEQYHSPSSEQGPDSAPAVVGGVDVPELAVGDASGGEPPAAVAVEPDAGMGETVSVATAGSLPTEDAAPVAKLPPVADEVGLEPVAKDPAADDVEPEPEAGAAGEGVPGGTSAATPAHPTGAPRLTPMVPVSTESPASGYLMSTPSVVVHPLETPSRLATNKFGKLDWRRTMGSGAYRFLAAAATVAGPQFM